MDIVEQVNDALSAADADTLYELLCNVDSRFENLYPEQALHYYNCLKKSRDNNPEVGIIVTPGTWCHQHWFL